MRLLLLFLLMLSPALAAAQSRTVLPSELNLTVTVEAGEHTPLTREMVLITIKGIYRRRITREKLVQPDFEGFSWTQLGSDLWREERLEGRKVTTFTRRMAVFPDRPGKLTIGPFIHELTLTDEGDDWFEHRVASNPVQIAVDPAPVASGWWFPVRRLRVSDEWSNAPDQLQPGEGVLRVLRVEALGVTPEMLPPMPELTSPSGMIFPHPEKRLAELTPQGPVSYAFWRWTIRPGNDTSAIVEPLSFGYFDTTLREDREVTISAQRVAYGTAIPASAATAQTETVAPRRTPGWLLAVLGAAVFTGSLALVQSGHRLAGRAALPRVPFFDPLARRLRRAARAGQIAETRRAARAIMRRDGATEHRRRLLSELDDTIFAKDGNSPRLRDFARTFL